ncbi:heparinase II/III domain-containing protein [Rhizohabitans arisaemae]|uniref:heparinase II/III domain-containing protein n=1 Tax=Rhizohabitans arisaemae TaxID=2720610 RepID=UPI0024B25742|nr:heparinase II/III family protein [Rhizohabitans arisaemae]
MKRAFGLMAAFALVATVVSVPGPAIARPTPCLSEGAESTAAQVMKGELTFLGQAPVRIGADIDWRRSPYGNRSWDLMFHSLRWIVPLISEFEKSKERRYLDRAAQIAEDWVADNKRGAAGVSKVAWDEHPIALRAPALVCLSAHVDDSWLRESLSEHARVLADPGKYEAGHNHGLDQDIALLGIGCRYNREEWTGLATRRMVKSVKIAIDGQGALIEQAPKYVSYVRDRWAVAERLIKACGLRVPAEVAERTARLPIFIAHATQPDGQMAPIGDTPADFVAPKVEQPAERVKIFKAGYVFGRTRWEDPKAAFYSIHFGPGALENFHGHEDHMGVTYQAQGRDVLVDVGFHSYENTSYRKWTLSPEAHNVPIVEGAPFRKSTATRLTGSRIRDKRESYTLEDRAFGVTRTRSVLVNHEQDLMAVLDRAEGGRRISNLWHLDRKFKIFSTAGGRVVFGEGDWRGTLVQLNSKTCKPAAGLKAERSWVSPEYLKRAPAYLIRSAPSKDPLLTLVVPGTDAPKVSCVPGKVTVGIDDVDVVVGVRADGELT